MDSGIFDARIFDSLIPYIQKIDSDGRIEISTPPHLNIDSESIKKYFEQDATLFFERGKPSLIKGTLKDSDVISYLFKKLREL